MHINTQTNTTVLVVEDYDDTRFLLRAMLEMRGYKVVEAADGRQAVEVAAKELPGLILMDLNLPVLDGFEATRQIHAQAPTRDVPVVAVSAQCGGEYRRLALEAGCLEYVSKPINFHAMNDIVTRYLAH